MYDAIVIGARCGGSPTAMLLARKGYRVLLVDRATFPSDTFRLHFVQLTGVACLERWGLLGRVVSSNCPPVRTRTVDLGDFPLTGEPAPLEGLAASYCPRRTVLDKILVDAAVEAGAELREGFAAQEIEFDGDRVTGIRGRSAGGGAVIERARIVIGADGMHSLVARMVDAPVYQAGPALACYYASYWSGVPREGFELYWRDRRALFIFPTNDDLTCITVGWPHRAFPAVRTALEASFLGALALVPELAEQVRVGRRVEPYRGTADLPTFFRRPYGSGWALVGDAGYHKDPFLARGISDAFVSAELLVEALDAGFAGRRPLAEALADYERRRNDAMRPLDELNLQLAALEPPTPQTLRLRAALRSNPEDTSRFLGVAAGSTSAEEFFAPTNLARVLAKAPVPA